MVRRLPIALLAACLAAAPALRALPGEPPEDGPYTEQWPDGKNKISAYYRGGKLDGTCTEFHTNGQAHKRASYRAGQLHGSYDEYDERGRRVLSTTYRDGKLEGSYQTWTPEGRARVRCTYRAGNIHGRYMEFSEDGRALAEDRVYLDGRLIVPRSAELINQRLAAIEATAGTGGPVYAQAPSKDPGSVNPGRVSDGHLAGALARLKCYRYLAGVPYEDVTLNERYNDEAQHAAVLLSIIGSLSHSPKRPAGVPEDFFKKAFAGCSNSNLAQGHGSLPRCVDSWMNDSDPSNIDRLGHRRWCINPTMQEAGFGIFEKFAAMWALDRGRKKNAPDFDWIAYPVPGCQPLRFFSGSWAWNLSLNPKKYAKPGKEARAAIFAAGPGYEKLPGKLEFNYEKTNVDSFGVPYCLIFRPKGLRASPGARYWVEVSGIKTKDDKDAPIEYFVEFVP